MELRAYSCTELNKSSVGKSCGKSYRYEKYIFVYFKDEYGRNFYPNFDLQMIIARISIHSDMHRTKQVLVILSTRIQLQ